MFTLRLILTALCLLALIAPAGVGVVDLCPCDAEAHGLFCATAPPAPSEPVHSCCAPPNEAPEAASAGHAGDECPDCPALDLEQDLLLTAPLEAPTWDLGVACLGSAPRSDAHAQSGTCAPWLCGWPQPPPGKLRRHLVLQVFLS